MDLRQIWEISLSDYTRVLGRWGVPEAQIDVGYRHRSVLPIIYVLDKGSKIETEILTWLADTGIAFETREFGPFVFVELPEPEDAVLVKLRLS